MAKHRRMIIIFTILVFISISLYLFFWMVTTPYQLFPKDAQLKVVMQKAITNIIGRKFDQVIGMTIAAILIASSSLVFQTITENRILTPSLIGFDAVFVTVQTLIVFLFTSSSIFYTNPYLNFVLASGLMIMISLSMYRIILKKNKNHLVFLLLVGMILSTLSRSLASFLQNIMDPMEFQSIVIRTEVTVSNMNTSIIYMSIPFLLIISFLFIKNFKTYDVMTLGESQAIGLGVEYQKKMNYALIYMAIAMSITTALIGPISFLGLITVNASRELLKTHKHLPLFILSSLIAMLMLILGQTIIIETGYMTTVSVWISLVGGIYMIYLLLKENEA
ncbi:MAG: iron chelate uptake ABC transporter family permease subunit [Acholeplasmataceae bacterium]